MRIDYIYALVDPLTFKIRYVGKSYDPVKRLKKHLKDSNKRSTHKECWIDNLMKIGLKPELLILDSCSDGSWKELEIEYISKFENLTNSTKGGDGLIGYKHSTETKFKMSSSRTGNLNPFFRKNHTTDTKNIISDKIKENIGLNGNPMNGKNLTIESRKKMSENGKIRARLGNLPKLPILSGPDNPSAKKRIFISPEGVEYTVYNTKKFCIEHDLSYSVILKNINKGPIQSPSDPKIKSRQRRKSNNSIGWNIIE